MKSEVTHLLLAGKYICPFATQAAFDYLDDPAHAEETDQWLERIGKRLARLTDSGAFYMAPIKLQSSDTAWVREDFLKYRDLYGNCALLLNLIRSANDDFTMQRGDMVQLAELEMAVNESTTLETQLRSFVSFVHEGSTRYTNRESLKKVLEHLVKEGFLHLVNAKTDLYQATGKIDQLAVALAIFVEHEKIISTESSEPEAPVQGSLLDLPEQPGAAEATDVQPVAPAFGSVRANPFDTVPSLEDM